MHLIAKTHDVTEGPRTGFPDHNVCVNFGATKGAGGVLERNLFWDASVFVHHEPRSTKILVNGGGNAFGEASPVLDASHGCAGFSPSHPKAKLYGRHAP